jgi:predicted MFS family arabinose efflux permease
MSTADEHASLSGAAGRPPTLLMLNLCLVPLVGLLGTIALAPFFPVVAVELQMSVTVLGQIPALLALTAAALSLIAGPLADRYGHRRLLLIGLLAATVSSLVTAAAGTIALLFGAALAGAVGRSILQPVTMAIAGTRFTGDLRRRAVSLVTATVSGSVIVGVPLLTLLGAAVGWRLAFVALAALAAATAAVSARILPQDPPPAEAPLMARTLFGGYRELVRHTPTLGLIVSYVLTAACMWGIWTYLGVFLVDRHHLGVGDTSVAYALFGVGFLVGSLAVGGPLGRLPLRPLAVGTTAVFGLVASAMFVLPVGPIAVIGLLPVTTALVGASTVARTTLLLNESPAGRATTMTLNTAAQSVGAALGSAAGGVLLALAGHQAIGLAVPVLAAGAALLIWASRTRPVARGALSGAA